MELKIKIGGTLRPWLGALLLLACIGRAESPTAEMPLEYWLADSAPFWTWDPATFEKQAAPLGFRWTQEGRSARAAPLQGEFFGKPAYESVVRFADGAPGSIIISYFNRGDAENALNQPDFESLVRELMTSITTTLRVQPRPGNNQSARTSVRDDSRIWQRPAIQFELSYSYTPPMSGEPFRAEYVRLTAKKFTAGEMPSHAITAVNPYAVRAHVTRDIDSGDVWIQNIPMVDQGPKGYCAAATAERVLRFFGQEVDQHQIAQIANTTSGGGTSTDDLKKALSAVCRQYDFSLNTHMEWDFRDFTREIDRYNRQARKNSTREVLIPREGVIMIAHIYQALDPETYKESRMGRETEVNKFKERVEKYVNAGCPLSWGVSLGMFEESTPTGVGGHLRLIIGYNWKKNQIIYSDSWGQGHGKKYLPLDQAFTITQSLFSLEPKGLRL
ncbi:MAG: hypothetical protein WD708_08625 [Kiritimatiellia bacterium]